MLLVKAFAVVSGTLCFAMEAAALVGQTVAGTEVMPEVLNLTGASLHVAVTIWMINRIDRLIKDVVVEFKSHEARAHVEAAEREDRREKDRSELTREMIDALRESSRSMAVFASKSATALKEAHE